jgi:hypothetical protein
MKGESTVKAKDKVETTIAYAPKEGSRLSKELRRVGHFLAHVERRSQRS